MGLWCHFAWRSVESSEVLSQLGPAYGQAKPGSQVVSKRRRTGGDYPVSANARYEKREDAARARAPGRSTQITQIARGPFGKKDRRSLVDAWGRRLSQEVDPFGN